MIVTRTITKKSLEALVHQTFVNFGNLTSSSLLDSLKFLGFYYATNAGISINVEDLKTPNTKQQFLDVANQEMKFVSEEWEKGFVSDTERFQTIIDSWNIATESLKNRIVDYYRNYDPANNLYIMAFSGARGNMSQVRQLVGMRGLMSDQEGRIIDLPIQTNFREGLSSIDYIISSYGARKGIVDTALKTADSGYLTRRLIYIAQDLIIRQLDCFTKNGVTVLLHPQSTGKNILGRFLLSSTPLFPLQKKKKEKERILSEIEIKKFQKKGTFALNLRSSLTCKANGSICQKCYGWDLAQQQSIALGEAVGIIAAQSIGEPGTQLTMRTFHTGGIFTSELLQQTIAPFSGKIEIPSSLKAIRYRTNHGRMVLKLQQESKVKIMNWEGKIQEIFLEIGSYLYIEKTKFLKKGELISEYSSRSIIPGVRRLKPIYTPISGEVKFESLYLRYFSRDEKPKVKVNQDDGILWLTSGKIFSLPHEMEFSFPSFLNKKKAFASLNIISPYEGVLKIHNNQLQILGRKKRIEINVENLSSYFRNCSTKVSIFPKNYQFIDRHTILGKVYLFPNYAGKIYAVRSKQSPSWVTFFLITESDVWKINLDQVENFSEFFEGKSIVRAGDFINSTLKSSKSGFLLKKDGFKLIFQNAVPIFVSRGTILNYKHGDLAIEKEALATLVNYTQQTEDIVQGLPKIEELIEARTPKFKAHLCLKPGVMISNSSVPKLERAFLNNETIHLVYSRETEEEYLKKQPLYLLHSISTKKNEELIVYKRKLWKKITFPSEFRAYPKEKKKTEFSFKNEKKKKLKIGKKSSVNWTKSQIDKIEGYRSLGDEISNWKPSQKFTHCFKNKQSQDVILEDDEKNYIFLEHTNPMIRYNLPLNSKIIGNPGEFIDIGEPLSEGIIDPHELLAVFFNYHSTLDGLMIGCFRSLNKFQLILVNSIQAIYQSQGVTISSKHIEIIVRQMTSKVIIKKAGDTPFLRGETVRLSLITEILKALSQSKGYCTPKYEPLFLSSTNSSLAKDGFLSAAGFQETKRVLTRAAIEGNSDWLRGLKECVILGRLIPAGSAFLNYKNYLDNIYLFKN